MYPRSKDKSLIGETNMMDKTKENNHMRDWLRGLEYAINYFESMEEYDDSLPHHEQPEHIRTLNEIFVHIDTKEEYVV